MNKIFFQGSFGAYSHMAALSIDPKAEIIPCKTFDECFLEASKDKLELLLSAQGVEKYTPEIDRPITEIDGCKAVETIDTNDNSKINFIHSVIKDGYKLQLTNNEIKIISDAEVVVYKLEKINE